MPAPDKAAAAEAVEKMVEEWFARSFRNSTLSRDTNTYNAALASKEDLKASIVGLFQPAATAKTIEGEKS